MSDSPVCGGRPSVLRRPAARRRSARAAWSGAATLVLLMHGVPAAASADASASALSALAARIDAEIGAAPCERDAQCRTLPIGERACGGPQRWLAWSTAQGDADKLQAWSQQTRQWAARRNRDSGLSSTCQYLADPGAACRQGRCELLPASSGDRFNRVD